MHIYIRNLSAALLVSVFGAAPVLAAEQNVSEEYGRFIQAFYQYEKSNHNPDLLRVLTRRAAARQQLMSSLMEENPQQFLIEALPSELREILPDTVKHYVESFQEYEGQLSPVEFAQQTRGYELRGDSGEVLQLHFATQELPQPTVTQAKVHGVYLEGHLVLADGGLEVEDKLITVARLDINRARN